MGCLAKITSFEAASSRSLTPRRWSQKAEPRANANTRGKYTLSQGRSSGRSHIREDRSGPLPQESHHLRIQEGLHLRLARVPPAPVILVPGCRGMDDELREPRRALAEPLEEEGYGESALTPQP